MHMQLYDINVLANITTELLSALNADVSLCLTHDTDGIFMETSFCTTPLTRTRD